MPKYETGKTHDQAQSDSRIVAEWSDKPFVAHDRRRDSVQHRVVLDHHGAAGWDVRHEVRSEDSDAVGDDWTPAEIWEVREHGITKVRAEDAGWFV